MLFQFCGKQSEREGPERVRVCDQVPSNSASSPACAAASKRGLMRASARACLLVAAGALQRRSGAHGSLRIFGA